MITYTNPQRVRHNITGDTGMVQVWNETYDPIGNKTYYTFLVKGDDGREWIADGRRLDIIEDEQ